MSAAAALSVPAAHGESLREAWRVALSQDLTLQASRDEVNAASEDLAAAKSARLPNVSANAGITRFNETPAFDFSGAGVPATLPLFGDENMEMAGASVSLPLFAGGSISRGIDAASAELDARTAQASVAAQQVKLDVAHHYINVLRAKRALEVADSTVTSLEAHVADVEDMFESGAVARNDLLSAAVSLADSEQRRLQARNALDLAHAAYNRALGRDLGAPVDLDENLPEVDSQLDLNSLESLTRMAVDGRNELGQYEAAADALRSQSEATRGKTRPRLALTGGYTSLKNEFLNRDDFWMIGIGVHWHLFDGGQTRRTANALSYRARALERERANVESWIALEVRQAWLRLQETQERTRLTERAVEQAEENLRVVRDRYRNGEGTNTEVLDAEMLRALSHGNYDNARFDARLALYEIARGVGRL
jgi:outer membrane protein TolC